MSRLIARPRWGAGGAWFVAAELLAQCLLLLAAIYVLGDVDLLRLEPLLVLGVGLAAYWTLRALSRDTIAFWLMAPTVVFPHIVAAWPHNRIEWQELLQFRESFADDRSVYWDVTPFLVCLALLITLHRIIGIKRLNRQMLLQQVDQEERGPVVRREAFLVIGLLLAGFLATATMMSLVALLPADEGWLLTGTSLAVAAIGGGAAVLFTLTILLWFRGLTSAREIENVMISDAMKGSRQRSSRPR